MRKQILKSFVIVSALSLLNFISRAQADYDKYISYAKKFYFEKQYLLSAKNYSHAFSSNKNLGRIDHRYAAASSWAMSKESDSAFNQLEKCIKGGYDEYFKAANDTTLTFLESDPRWQTILEAIKNNKQKNDARRNSSILKPNVPFIKALDTVLKNDQWPRFHLDKIQQKFGRNSPEMMRYVLLLNRTDSINISELKSLISKYTWPTKENVGENGMHTIFLIVQHSDLNSQKYLLPLLRQSVKNNDISPSSLALLEDRIAIRSGKKQKYGSQLQLNNITGKYYVYPIRNLRNLNKRRESVGLNKMEDYVRTWEITWNLDQYKSDLKDAKKAVRELEWRFR